MTLAIALALVLLCATVRPDPPFVARLVVNAAHIHARPEVSAPAIGIIREGDEVRVLGWTSDCTANAAWALLDGEGAVSAALLAPTSSAEPASPVQYSYGRVGPGGAAVFAAPEDGARRIAYHRAGQDLAFVEEPELAVRGWLKRPRHGGFVRARAIRPMTASAFHGERDPVLPIGFFLKDLDGAHRHDRGTVIEERDGIVRLEGGSFPRRVIRIARRRAMPEALPADARWVHVSLREQTLVAYEGSTPVYATLVSTGLAVHPTPRGLFSVWYKAIYMPMHGDPPEPYFVDEVPFVQFIKKGVALHGTFWHERFGRTASHSCVNLSIADAAWLFAWAPPTLPPGWHEIEPAVAKRTALWVLIES